jgi:hypothetical protein
MTTRPTVIRVEGTPIVLLLQRSLLKMGRNRLWRMRDDIARRPAGPRELLTRRRTGFVRSESPSAAP